MKKSNARLASNLKRIARLPTPCVFLVSILVVHQSAFEVLFAQDLSREISFGLTARELRQKAVEYAPKKDMPIDLSTHYFKRGQIAVAAIWEHKPTADFKFRGGLLRADIKKAIADFGPDGYRLIHFTGTGRGGEELYSGIWIRGEGQQLYVRYGIPLKELVKMNEKFVLDGYSILRLATFEEKGRVKFTAIWDNPDVGPRILDHRLSLARFRKSIEKRTADGFRLVQAVPYPTRRNFYFSAIWEPSRGRKQKIVPGATRLEIRKMEKEMAAQNFRPQSIAAYRRGRKDRHIMIWEENDVAVAKKKTKAKKPTKKTTNKTKKKSKPLTPIK